jgi:predicted nuclease with TOPRIM domain
MTSLEQYNEKYEILKKEQTELLESANQKIEQLKTSNEMIKEVLSQELASLTLSMQQETKNLIKKSEKEISTLSDNFGKILSTLNIKIEDTYNKNTKRITEETTSMVQKCQELQESSKKRFNSYYNRKKIVDWLIYLNLGITPIFLILLFFVKK